MNALSIGFLIFMGGGLGSVLRFLLTKLGQSLYETKFPIGTVLVNFLACIVLGSIIYFAKDKISAQPIIKYFLIIGFCGGFSTFSTFGLETVNLFKSQLFLLGSLNVLISLGLGFIVLWALVR